MRIELISPAIKRWFTIVMVVVGVIATAGNVAAVRAGHLQIYDGALHVARDVAWSMPAVFMFVVAAVNRRVLKAIMLKELSFKTRASAEDRAGKQNGKDAVTGGQSSPDGEEGAGTGKSEDRPDGP